MVAVDKKSEDHQSQSHLSLKYFSLTLNPTLKIGFIFIYATGWIKFMENFSIWVPVLEKQKTHSKNTIFISFFLSESDCLNPSRRSENQPTASAVYSRNQ